MLEQARTQATSAPRIGASYGDVRAARVQATRSRLQQTSASAAASARLETVRIANAARSLQEAARTGEPLSMADASYFTSSHLVAEDLEDELGHPTTSSISRAATLRDPSSSRGQTRQSSSRGVSGAGWDRSPAASPLSEEAKEHIASSRQSPRKSNVWSQLVEQRQRTADAGGISAFAAAEEFNRSPAGSQSARGPRPSNSFSSPSSFPLHAVSDPVNGSFDLSSANAAAPQPWWTRLHNSENKTNSSPYGVGNKSVYYPDKADKQQQKVEESKESHQQHQATLPRLSSRGGGGSMTARGGVASSCV